MTTEPRYELATGKFEQYFYDAQENEDMPLTEVLDLLNEAAKADSEQVLEIRRLTRELGERTDECDALQTQIDGEVVDWMVVRKRFGARDDETLGRFIERLATECRPHAFVDSRCSHCGVVDKVLEDIAAERDEAQHAVEGLRAHHQRMTDRLEHIIAGRALEKL